MVTAAPETEVDRDVAKTAQLKHCTRSLWALQYWTLLTKLDRQLRALIFCDVYKEQTQTLDLQVRGV
jgi:hypothetical protein